MENRKIVVIWEFILHFSNTIILKINKFREINMVPHFFITKMLKIISRLLNPRIYGQNSTGSASERLQFKQTDGRHFWPRRNFQSRRYCIKEVSNITTIELGKIIFAYLKLLQANAPDMINESSQTSKSLVLGRIPRNFKIFIF